NSSRPGGRGAGSAGRVIGDNRSYGKAAFVGVSVAPGDGEAAAAAAHGAGGGGAVAPIDCGREVTRGVCRVSVAEGCHVAGEAYALDRRDRLTRWGQHIAFVNGSLTGCGGAGGPGSILGQGNLGRERSLVGIGVRAGDGERAALGAADGAGGGRAVAPVDGRGELAGVTGAGMVENGHGTAEGSAFGGAKSQVVACQSIGSGGRERAGIA